MLAKSTKLILMVCLLMTLLLSILACVTYSDPNRTSIKDLDITMDVNRLGEFRAQLRKFAEKHSLEYTEKFYNADNTFFSAVMKEDDFVIVLNNSSDSLGIVGISFFNRASPPISQERLDKLVNDLKSFINEIRNVTITEKINGLKIRIATNRNQEVYNQLQKFADKHSLEFTLSFSSDKTLFNLEIYGDGFHITGENSLYERDVDDIYLFFYTDINNEIPNPTPQESLAELFNDLKSFIDEIPNVTIIEEK